jgi:hypothetical protein
VYNINLFFCQKLPVASRPGEIPNWMKSKKKDYVPSIIPSRYGPLFTKWWKGLQPAWRAQGDEILSCNTPTGENWALLRKGGTAGMYTVVMGLSWWIKAQAIQCDADSWFIVNDITWIIHQMYIGNTTDSGTSADRKCAREAEDTGAKQRITKRCRLLP